MISVLLATSLLTANALAGVPAQHTSFSRRPYAAGYTTRQGVEFLVVGTSHFRCNSAAEVRSVILNERPDGVVVELDPERVVRLTKEHALSSESQLFGADFLSAIDTARELDVPLFIGDEYTQETRARFWETLLCAETYSPSKLLNSVLAGADSKVNLVRAFLDDPMKFTPIVISLAIPFISLSVAMLRDVQPASSNGATAAGIETLLSLLFSIVLASKVYNTLIVDRDAVLASKAMDAAKAISSLKNKETIRKTWTFNADSDGNTDTSNGKGNSYKDMMPLFTLKTPLEADSKRNLNLFEPRWLAMIDELKKEEQAPQFGCISCTNKFYSVVKKDGKEGRYADLIFQRTGRIANLVDIKEGSRPSGARKVHTRIEGSHPFTVKEDCVFVSEEGYLMTPKSMVSEIRETKGVSIPPNKDSIKIVIVVGLLHVNGILDRIVAETT